MWEVLVIKILKIFAIAYTLFFLYSIAGAIAKHDVNTWFANHFNWKTPIKYLFFCTIDFAIPLWYLIAMIEVYILWLFIVKNGLEDTAVRITPILYVLQVILTIYCETMGLAWPWKINFAVRGLPWFLLGYYLNTPDAYRIRRISTNNLCILVAIGCAIAVIPTAFDLPIKFNVIGYIPYALGLFVLTLKDSDESTCRRLEFIGEKLSLYVYILHVLVAGMLVRVLNCLGVDTNGVVFLWCKPILVVIATILISFSFFLLKSRIQVVKSQGRAA